MPKYIAYYNNSGNRMDTVVPSGTFYADNQEDANRLVHEMFGHTAWAEELDIDFKAS